MLLSIGMMVKNEEKYLEDCLKALQPILDSLEAELIIVDTGSIDRTIEIAKKYTDKLYFHEWNNNFAEMRNKTISYCSGEWFFCIDGDEVLEDTQNIIDFFKSKEYKKYRSAILTVKNFVNSNDLSLYNTVDGLRLFKKDKDFKYIGEVHNQPQFKKPVKKIISIINHYGYLSDDKELMEKKFIRTATILKEQLKKKPMDIYVNFQLSISYSMHGDKKEALLQSTKAYELALVSDTKKYLYAITNQAQCLLGNNMIEECKEVCIKGLELIKKNHPYKIDLYYYLGKCQILSDEFEESIDSYLVYLDLLLKFRNGELPVDISITNNCMSFEEDAYRDIIISNYKMNRYKQVCKFKSKIVSDSMNEKLTLVFTESYVKSGLLNELIEYYDKDISKLDEDVIRKFYLKVESLKSDLSKDEQLIIDNLLTKINYCKNKNIYEFKMEDSDEARKIVYEFIDKYNILEKKADIFLDVLYAAFRCKCDIMGMCSGISYDLLIESIDQGLSKYFDFHKLVLAFIHEKCVNLNRFQDYRTLVVLCRVLLIKDEMEEKEYEFIFKLYTRLGSEFVTQIYSSYIIKNELIDEVKNDEHRFFIYMLKTNEFKENNKIQYIRYLKHALEVYPYMKKGIELLLNETKEQEEKVDNEMNKLKTLLMNNIEQLILNKKFSDVERIINEYEKLFGEDFELLYVKSELALN